MGEAWRGGGGGDGDGSPALTAKVKTAPLSTLDMRATARLRNSISLLDAREQVVEVTALNLSVKTAPL